MTKTEKPNFVPVGLSVLLKNAPTQNINR